MPRHMAGHFSFTEYGTLKSSPACGFSRQGTSPVCGLGLTWHLHGSPAFKWTGNLALRIPGLLTRNILLPAFHATPGHRITAAWLYPARCAGFHGAGAAWTAFGLVNRRLVAFKTTPLCGWVMANRIGISPIPVISFHIAPFARQVVRSAIGVIMHVREIFGVAVALLAPLLRPASIFFVRLHGAQPCFPVFPPKTGSVHVHFVLAECAVTRPLRRAKTHGVDLPGILFKI